MQKKVAGKCIFKRLRGISLILLGNILDNTIHLSLIKLYIIDLGVAK